MKPYTVVLFRNSRADSSYIAYVTAESEDHASYLAVTELVKADRAEGLRLDPKHVCIGFIFVGHHQTSQHPWASGLSWTTLKGRYD